MVAQIPNAADDGWLPPGIYMCTLADVQERFGQFRDCDRRPTLWNKLVAYFEELSKWPIATVAVIDGSFVSGRRWPGDVDVALGVRDDFFLRAADWRPTESNLVDKRFCKRQYEIDLWPASGELGARRWADTWQHRKPPESGIKGVLWIAL